MTYDQWKTTDPTIDCETECDCCDRVRAVTSCWAYGIETFACDECRGVDDDDE